MSWVTPKLALVPLGLILTGCPIYDNGDCAQDRDVCASGFVCDLRSGDCISVDPSVPGHRRCNGPTDCRSSETCDEGGRCSVGSCAIHGCVGEYRCVIKDARHRCELPDSSPKTNKRPADASRDAAAE